MSAIFWFFLLVVFLLLEASTVSLVSAWFALGALAAMIASLCGAEIWLEMILFVAVSTVTLAALRPVTKKFINPRIIKTNVDSLVGQQGLVTCVVDNGNGSGTVKLGSIEWSARSTEDKVIREGALVKVDRIEGVKAFVTEIS